jgi:hypothetical protein
MWKNPRVVTAAHIAAHHGGFLFQLLPDLFPPMLTELESGIWARYYQEQQARQKRS